MTTIKISNLRLHGCFPDSENVDVNSELVAKLGGVQETEALFSRWVNTIWERFPVDDQFEATHALVKSVTWDPDSSQVSLTLFRELGDDMQVHDDECDTVVVTATVGSARDVSEPNFVRQK